MRHIALLLFVLASTVGSLAQDSLETISPVAPPRPKVAVVLSGGGAKGMAHIGALKVIERAGIPIDIVTGTSMGSIVGGLYAIGYNANVLDSVVRVQDWSYVISDRENLAEQSLDDRRRQNTYFYTLGLTFGKRNKSDGGLIKGKNLAELFGKLCEGYTDSLDFSRDLPIPFACVATNIVDNTEVDLHSGSLPQAMRASMAIPAAFSPVRIGNQVLVDGGLRNNYPADLARQMGADVIIGVTVQGPPKIADDMGGTMSILSQIIDVNCKNKYDENLAITDVPIRVNTTGYGAASFSLTAIDTLIRRGEEEAMRHWDELLALKRRLGLDSGYMAPRLTPRNPDALTQARRVTSYTFENMTIHDERFLRRKFNLKPGDEITPQREQQLTTAMRLDLFYQSAECHLVPERQWITIDGKPTLVDGVRVVLTAGNRKSSEVGVAFRYDMEEHAALQLGASFPVASQTLPMDVSVTLRLGKRMKAKVELTLHTASIAWPKLSYAFNRNDIDVYIDGDRDYSILYYHHQTELIPLNFNIRNFNFTIGARWDFLNYKEKLLSSRTADITLDNDHYISYRATVNFNNENNWNFPSRGSRFRAEYAYMTDNFAQMGGKAGVSDVSAHWRTSIPVGSRFALQPMLYGRMLFGTGIPLVFSNFIGGHWFAHYVDQQMPFAGIGNIEYVGRHFAALQLQVQQRIGSSHYVQLAFAGAQQAPRLAELLDHRTLLGARVSYFYNTIAGPVGASLGYSSRTQEFNFYINLGFEF